MTKSTEAASTQYAVALFRDKGRSEESIAHATGLTLPQIDALLRKAGLKS